MIVYSVIAALIAAVASLFVIVVKQNREITFRIVEHESNRDMLVHMSQVVSEIGEHVDILEDSVNSRFESLEDYLKIIKSETENEKHPDYWSSVMNYNPLLHKEPEE